MDSHLRCVVSSTVNKFTPPHPRFYWIFSKYCFSTYDDKSSLCTKFEKVDTTETYFMQKKKKEEGLYGPKSVIACFCLSKSSYSLMSVIRR